MSLGSLFFSGRALTLGDQVMQLPVSFRPIPGVGTSAQHDYDVAQGFRQGGLGVLKTDPREALFN